MKISVDKQVIEQALEALDESLQLLLPKEQSDKCRRANFVLRTVLEQQQEQTNPWRDAVDNELVSLHMVASDDPRESIQRLINWHCAVHIDPLVSSAAQDLIERGKREALKQQDTKPAAEVVFRAQIIGFGRVEPRKDVRFLKDLKIGTMLYTDPPRREWVNLTDEEIVKIVVECHRGSPSEFYLARDIEQALKERNNG